jgi:hypothetical protein
MRGLVLLLLSQHLQEVALSLEADVVTTEKNTQDALAGSVGVLGELCHAFREHLVRLREQSQYGFCIAGTARNVIGAIIRVDDG